ncbi:TPM domain-containing protein [Sphingobacterium bovisgrunnientis]|uniref:TPM domain-containing protein n=1 Tax=Sphingobacterium bovisgrunnientis TaxID=1874697 RepID=UPI001357FC93
MVIVTLNNAKLTEENFDKYAIDLSNFWGVGTKEKNDGLPIVLSPQLRKIRLATGL